MNPSFVLRQPGNRLGDKLFPSIFCLHCNVELPINYLNDITLTAGFVLQINAISKPLNRNNRNSGPLCMLPVGEGTFLLNYYYYNSQPLFCLSRLQVFACVKDGAYFCYCACVPRISGFLWVVPTNTGIFLRGLKLCGESRT